MTMDQVSLFWNLFRRNILSVLIVNVSFIAFQVMACINKLKATNATVVLADGSSIGAMSENLTYKDLSGTIGFCIKFLAEARKSHSAEFGEDKLMEEMSTTVLENVIEEAAKQNSVRQELDHIKALVESLNQTASEKENTVLDPNVAKLFSEAIGETQKIGVADDFLNNKRQLIKKQILSVVNSTEAQKFV